MRSTPWGAPPLSQYVHGTVGPWRRPMWRERDTRGACAKEDRNDRIRRSASNEREEHGPGGTAQRDLTVAPLGVGPAHSGRALPGCNGDGSVVQYLPTHGQKS